MERLKRLLSKVLGINEESITDDTSSDNVETWDSFNGLLLISELENVFNIKLTIGEVRSMNSVKDIKEILNKYCVNLK